MMNYANNIQLPQSKMQAVDAALRNFYDDPAYNLSLIQSYTVAEAPVWLGNVLLYAARASAQVISGNDTSPVIFAKLIQITLEKYRPEILQQGTYEAFLTKILQSVGVAAAVPGSPQAVLRAFMETSVSILWKNQFSKFLASIDRNYGGGSNMTLDYFNISQRPPPSPSKCSQRQMSYSRLLKTTV